MEYKTNENPNKPVDWNDDSGEVHTVKETYKTTWDDGWQESEFSYKTGSKVAVGKSMFRGNKVETHYETDNYKVVVPGYIISTILVIALCVVMWFVKPIMGGIFTVFGLFWVVGFWKHAPIKKWKNQAKKSKETDYKNNGDKG